MKNLSDLQYNQVTQRASDKLEGLLFFAHKKLEELELKRDGVLISKLDTDQIIDSITSQKREVDVLNFIYELIEHEVFRSKVR